MARGLTTTRRVRVALVMGACLAAACGADDGSARPDPTTPLASTTQPTSTGASADASAGNLVTTTPSTSSTSTLAPATSTTVADWRRFPIAPIDPRPGTPVLTRIETTDPVVFLTIDDGYTRDPRVPELLAQHGATATLFVLTEPVHQDPAYFAQFIELGGSVNSHTRNHPHLPELDAEAQRREVCDASSSIARNLGTSGPYFRPPYGEWNSDTVHAARSCRLRAVVLWSVSVNHSVIVAPAGSIRPGDILILHFRDDLYTDLLAVFAELDRLGLSVARLEDYLPPR